MSKLKVVMEENKLCFGVDSNEDGENAVELKLNMSEGVQEILARGEAVEGAKVVDFKLDAQGLVLKLDTDKDGEELLELKVSLFETLDEGKELIEGLKKTDA